MNLINGKIIKGIGGFYYVEPSDSTFLSETLIECKPRGVLRYQNTKPTVGDFVTLEKSDNTWYINDIQNRKNLLIRPPVSNVDLGLLCLPIKTPNPDLTLLDKLIVNCLLNDIYPVVCLTKVDLDHDRTEEIELIYSNAGFEVLKFSIEEDDDLDKLLELIKDKTAFLAGPSGAGKSTLANRFSFEQMETGELSRKLNRGKHTTRHVELLHTQNHGFLLDTPGFSSLDLEELEAEDLKDFYPEFKNSQCRFSNCNHIKEPGCEVREKVRNHEIDIDRYKRYKAFFNYLKSRKPY